MKKSDHLQSAQLARFDSRCYSHGSSLRRFRSKANDDDDGVAAVPSYFNEFTNSTIINILLYTNIAPISNS